MVQTILDEPLYQKFNLHLIEKSWIEFFQEQIKQKYFPDLLTQIDNEYQNRRCCPSQKDVFRLFQEISLPQIKVVILGQDPYHQSELIKHRDGSAEKRWVADGIAFSTQKPGYIPATLQNIFLELGREFDCPPPTSSNLLPWVKEGVFLLNTALTVQKSEPLSHMELWEEFTYSLIKYLNNYNPELVWIFWGKKAELIKNECQIADKFSIISTHPSPFSVNLGVKHKFFGSKPFSRVNNLLIETGKNPVNWLSIEKPAIK
ncbi:uracil-DNA glycosylase [endosymbiont GvMRE of Glomus versiforme]|uniref:uracil-DNA glycosylase n=1 Tax=endosymbiont GvMRE of Glomus versiforme TaxID=2039283 RepID=UPI000EBE4AD0|nr:uracil-DNA glycosylase [endosymbiont GvMRE of Glomus versiforme]RHZ37588.1 Uracil-DNA glycosylase [endosymbiont GvMRE of Glomus versiforme]